MTKKILLILGLFSLVGCSTLKNRPNAYQEYQSSPFTADLDRYEKRMKDGKTMMWVGLTASILSFVGSTLLINFANPVYGNNRWLMNEKAFKPVLYGSYGLNLLSIGVMGGGFIKWERNSKYYYDTLRLQSQYYNILTPVNYESID